MAPYNDVLRKEETNHAPDPEGAGQAPGGADPGATIEEPARPTNTNQAAAGGQLEAAAPELGGAIAPAAAAETGSADPWRMIPAALRELRQWVCWRPETRDGRLTKIPINSRTGNHAACDTPATWSDFETAAQACERFKLPGVGFVFTSGDSFCGIDLDKCVDPQSGQLEPWARSIVDQVRSYTEITPSGRGLHIIARGSLPPGGGRRKGQVEMYDAGRYFTMTGQRLEGTPAAVEDRTAELLALHVRTFGAGNGAKKNGSHPPAPAAPPPDPPGAAASGGLLQPFPEAKLTALLENNHLFKATWERKRADFPSASEYDQSLANFAAQVSCSDSEIRALMLAWRTKHGEDTSKILTRTKYVADTIAMAREGAAPKASGVALPKHRTDCGNARRLVEAHGSDLRFVPRAGWLIWDGRRWAPDETGEIERRAKDVVRGIYEETALIMDDAERKALVKHALNSEAQVKIRAMVQSAQSEPEMIALPDQFDQDSWLLTVANGTIDLHTGKIRPHSRADFITRLAPVEYDPAAACPLWDATLEQIFAGDRDLIAFVQRSFGYALSGDVSERATFVFHGGGRNGKTTLLEVIRDLLGDYAGQVEIESLMTASRSCKDGSEANPEIRDLIGLRFVTSSETEDGLRLAESRLKRLTGGNSLKARGLYEKKALGFKPTFKLFLDSNHKPLIRGTDDAIWDRIKLVPFLVRFPEDQVDKKRREKLAAEFPGILRWMIEGCLAWQRQGLGDPGKVRAATKDYRHESDLVGQFLDDWMKTGPGVQIEAGRLYDMYRFWCKQRGERPETFTRLGLTMKERGFNKSHDSKTKRTVYIGLCLNSDTAGFTDQQFDSTRGDIEKTEGIL